MFVYSRVSREQRAEAALCASIPDTLSVHATSYACLTSQVKCPGETLPTSLRSYLLAPALFIQFMLVTAAKMCSASTDQFGGCGHSLS